VPECGGIFCTDGIKKIKKSIHKIKCIYKMSDESSNKYTLEIAGDSLLRGAQFGSVCGCVLGKKGREVHIKWGAGIKFQFKKLCRVFLKFLRKVKCVLKKRDTGKTGKFSMLR